MATIRKVHARWQAVYRGPDGRERQRTFDRKSDADQFLAEVRVDMARGSYVDPSAGRRLFGDYARSWQAAQVHRPSTSAQLDSLLRNHIIPAFDRRPLASVRPSEVQAWVKGLSMKLAPSTTELVYRYLVAVFKAAVADRLIAVNPATGMRLPKREARKVVPLATDAVENMLDFLPERYRALVLLTAGTGMRQGEALGLDVGQVDFLRRSLEVTQQLVVVGGAKPYLGPPKTAASVRTIPLPNIVVAALAEHLEQFPAVEQQIPRRTPQGELEPVTARLMFTTNGGDPIRRGYFNEKVWAPAAKAAKLPEGAGFHALRHYYASLLIQAGESVKVVQARLGHATAAETLDTYSHLWPDTEDHTRQAVDGVLGRSKSETSRGLSADLARS